MKFINKKYFIIFTLLIVSVAYLSFPEKYIETGFLDLNYNNNIFYIRGTLDNIKISSWKNKNIRIKYKKSVFSNSKNEAKEKLKHIIFDSYSLDKYTIFSPKILKKELNKGILNQIFKKNQEKSISLDISVPKNCKFKIDLNKGNIAIKNIFKGISAVTDKGNISISHTKGHFKLKSYKGNITGNYLEGMYRIFAKKGNIKVNNLKGIISADAPKGKINIKHYEKIFAQK